jgi:hypothetical protein
MGFSQGGVGWRNQATLLANIPNPSIKSRLDRGMARSSDFLKKVGIHSSPFEPKVVPRRSIAGDRVSFEGFSPPILFFDLSSLVRGATPPASLSAGFSSISLIRRLRHRNHSSRLFSLFSKAPS